MLFLKVKEFTKKTINQNLKLLYGLGCFQIKKVCQYVGVQEGMLFKRLSVSQKQRVYKYIEDNILIENSLKKFQRENKNFLAKVKNLRSLRNKAGLPVRGQRTHTNGKTKRKLRNG